MTEVSFAKTFLTTLDNKSTKYQPNYAFDPGQFALRIPYILPKLSSQHPAPPKPQDDLSKSIRPPPGAEPALTTTNAINITLRSNRNPAMTLTLASTAPSTTITSIREQIYSYLGGSATISSTDKIKILQNKKPIPSSKHTVAELVDADTKELELGVMVIGGAPDPPPQDKTAVTARPPEPAGPDSENAAIEAETGINPAEQAKVVETMQGVESTATSSSQPVQLPADAGAALLHEPEFWTDLEGFLAQRLRSQEEAVRLKSLFQRAWTSSIDAP